MVLFVILLTVIWSIYEKKAKIYHQAENAQDIPAQHDVFHEFHDEYVPFIHDFVFCHHPNLDPILIRQIHRRF